MDTANISPAVQQRVFGEFFLALGEFVTNFTGVEHLLACSIKNVLSRQMRDGRNEWLVNAVVGGMRIGAAKATVKRVLRVQKFDSKHIKLIDKCFAHLGDIEWLRNRLMHNPTLLRGTDAKHVLMNFDFASAVEEEKSEIVAFAPGVLRAASSDLIAIKALVDDIMSIHSGLIEDRDLALPSWRYKPLMLVRHRHKSPGTHRRRSTPLRS